MATISNLHFRSLIYGVDLRLQIREGEAALIYSYDLDPSTWDSGLAISIQTQSSQDSPLASAARLDIRAIRTVTQSLSAWDSIIGIDFREKEAEENKVAQLHIGYTDWHMNSNSLGYAWGPLQGTYAGSVWLTSVSLVLILVNLTLVHYFTSQYFMKSGTPLA